MVGNLTPFLCLLWPACWLGGCQLGLRGSPKGSKKGPQNDPKSIRNPPGRPLACPRVSGGTPQVPPRLPTCIFMHIYAYLCIYLQYFVHIYAYFAHIYACFHWFPAYLCILLYKSPIFMHIYACLCIFRHIYECLCIFDAYLYTSVLFVDICTYLHIPIHEKTLICWQWKIMQPGYTPQGVEISASTLNIHLSIRITGSIDIHSNAVPEWHHGTVAGSALCAFR